MPGIGPRLIRRRCQRCDKPLYSQRKFCSHACAATKDYCRVWTGTCAVCGGPFVARRPTATCGPYCSRKYRNRSTPATRNKHHKRRTVTGKTDITPEQEAAMRKRARKCPLCGVAMTSKPGKPGSKHLDHIVPINQGGTHTHGNVRIICRTCNLKRPKDGSDYTGPVTLWAQVPQVMMPPPKVAAPKLPYVRFFIVWTLITRVEPGVPPWYHRAPFFGRDVRFTANFC